MKLYPIQKSYLESMVILTCGKSRPSSDELNSHFIFDVDVDEVVDVDGAFDFVASAIDKLLFPSCQY